MFLKKFKQRVAAYPIALKPDVIPEHSDYLRLSEELLKFTIQNRLRVLIIFAGAAGTPHEHVVTKLRAECQTRRAVFCLSLYYTL